MIATASRATTPQMMATIRKRRDVGVDLGEEEIVVAAVDCGLVAIEVATVELVVDAPALGRESDVHVLPSQ